MKGKTFILLLALVWACGDSDSRVLREGDEGKSYSLAVGDDAELVLGVIGPGYADPELSSEAVRFEGDEALTRTPGGHTHQWRFHCLNRGTSHVLLRRLDDAEDTFEFTLTCK